MPLTRTYGSCFIGGKRVPILRWSMTPIPLFSTVPTARKKRIVAKVAKKLRYGKSMNQVWGEYTVGT